MSDIAASKAALRRNQLFYDRWRHAYDVFTRRIIPLTGPRADAAAALEISDGDQLIEFGCGTGPNIPHIARGMASHDGCQYTGIDIAPGALRRAQALVERQSLANVAFLHADATDPPIAGPVDAVLSTFAVTIFADPEAVVSRWFDLLGEGGRLVLLNTHPSDSPRSWLLNPFFNLFLVAANPIDPRTVFDVEPWKLLRQRVAAAEQMLEQRASDCYRVRYYGGLVSMCVAQK